MGPSTFLTLDPEFEAILAKVAADPDSALLRVPRPQRIVSLFEREPARETESRFSVAERHLLHAYRSEVAGLLRDVCRMKLIEEPRSREHVSPYKPEQGRNDCRDIQDLAARVHRGRKASENTLELEPAWALVEKCVGGVSTDEPTVSQLAQASLRLEPCDEARIFAAVDLMIRNAPRTAVQILRRVISEYPTADIQLHAWNNLGAAHSFAGELAKAHECYLLACSIQEERVEPWMNRLVFGIQLGLVDDACEASRAIDGLIAADHPLLLAFARSQASSRSRGAWKPSRQSGDTLSGLESRIGPSARRIALVFE